MLIEFRPVCFKFKRKKWYILSCLSQAEMNTACELDSERVPGPVSWHYHTPKNPSPSIQAGVSLIHSLTLSQLLSITHTISHSITYKPFQSFAPSLMQSSLNHSFNHSFSPALNNVSFTGEPTENTLLMCAY